MIVDTEPEIVMGVLSDCRIGRRSHGIPPYSYFMLKEQCPISYKDGVCQRCGEEFRGFLTSERSRTYTHCNNGWVVCGRCFYDSHCKDGRQLIELLGECLNCNKPLRTGRVEIHGYHISFVCFQCGVKHVRPYDSTIGLQLKGSPEIPEAKVGEVKWQIVQ